MRKIVAILASAVFAIGVMAGCASEQAPQNTSQPQGTGTTVSGIVKTGGSTSMEKVCETLKQAFVTKNPDVTVNIEYNGSGDGIKGSGDGTYDIGNSSRDIKETEEGLTAHILGIDGIAVIINKDNEKVSDLTMEQLKKIYTGEITNWKDLGGNDKPIAVVSREEGSGTRVGFQSVVGYKSSELTKNAEIGNSTGNVITTVSSNSDAIGYISVSELNDTVKATKVEGVEPTVENIKANQYKIQRNFIMVTKSGAELSPQAAAFLDFCFSPEAAPLISKAGLIPVQTK